MRYAAYQYDESLSPGNIITSYSKGFFRIVRIEQRYYTASDEKSFDFLEKKFGRRPSVGDEINPLIYSERILTDTFRRRKGKDSCDACFCRRVPAEMLEKILAVLAEEERPS